MKKLLLSVLLMLLPLSASAMDPDLEQQFQTRRAMQYWGLGGGVIGGATAVPMTITTMETIKNLRHSRNAVEACINAGIAILVVPPMIVLTGATWAGGVGGTAVGLGGSLAARSTLREAGGNVTPVPGLLGIASLSATPALLILGLDAEEESLIIAGIATFAGANAMLLTQSLLNGAEYRELTGTERGLVIPPITFSGRF